MTRAPSDAPPGVGRPPYNGRGEVAPALRASSPVPGEGPPSSPIGEKVAEGRMRADFRTLIHSDGNVFTSSPRAWRSRALGSRCCGSALAGCGSGRAFACGRSRCAFAGRSRGSRCASSRSRSGLGARCRRRLFFALQSAGDRRNREVAVLDHRRHLLRQLHRRDVDRAADLETREVDVEVLRDLVVGAVDLDLMAHDVQDAAALQAGRRPAR